MKTLNIDPQEIAKFTALSQEWWDKEGKLRTLHDLNPIRLAFIEQHCTLAGAKVLDVGCGGGILSESLAKAGAHVTAIDMDESAIRVAIQHAADNNLVIHYLHQAIETLPEQQFDVITCMEMLEHVPDPAAILQHCARLLKPDAKLLVSTLNRHPKAYALAIVGAEYVLGLLPRGTHDYAKFIKPSELAEWARQVHLNNMQLAGVRYHPYSRRCELTTDVRVNYLACFQAEA